MKSLKPGDRIRVYYTFQDNPIRTVDCVEGESVKLEENGLKVHHKQCRLLKKKTISVRVTREKLAKAWNAAKAGYNFFDNICRELGLGE